MARGWESKQTEAQQEDASRKAPLRPRQSPETIARAQQRESLQLSRSRTVQQLTLASAPPHRRMLQAALAAIDARLAALDEPAE